MYVSDLIDGGLAQKDGRIVKGDHILVINGNDVKFAHQETVASLLKVGSLIFRLFCSVYYRKFLDA